MKLLPAGMSPSKSADLARQTDEVWTDDLADGVPPHRTRIACAAFAPRARTAWHRHPFRQVPHGVSGVGLVCRAGDEPILLKAGDRVMIAQGERHWHGAMPDRAFVHLAIQDADADGRMADWKDLVDEAAYRMATGRT